LGISLVLAGALVEEACHREAVAEHGSVVIKPASLVHANRVGPAGALVLAVALLHPDVASGDGLRGAGDPRRDLGRWRWSRDAALASRVMRALALTCTEQPARCTGVSGSGRPEGAGPGAGTAIRAAEVLRDVISAATASQVAAAAAPIPGWLHVVRRALENVEPGGRGVGALAAAAGVHPVYLARRFREAFGCSPREYRRHVRVRTAVQLISAGRTSLVDVAHRAGFADQSHLCRALRAAAGVSPAALRRLGAMEARG
jgi:AraC family transcriptional regulator